jgi:hypothetical protein
VALFGGGPGTRRVRREQELQARLHQRDQTEHARNLEEGAAGSGAVQKAAQALTARAAERVQDLAATGDAGGERLGHDG